MGTPPRKREIRVYPAGEDQTHVSRQMLQKEAHALMNSWIFDHLIIIQNEHDRGRMDGASFQFMEQRHQDGDQRRWLGRLQHR